MKSTILHLLLKQLQVQQLQQSRNLKQHNTLRFNKDGEFTILQFTDQHLGENFENDQKTLNLHRNLLKRVKPDLAVLTGDLVSGYAWKNHNGFFYDKWFNITQIFQEQKIPYAYAFGNHDHQGDLDIHQIASLDMDNPYSLFQYNQAKDDQSASNYFIKIFSGKKGREKEVTTGLWILDSKDRGCDEIQNTYACIGSKQMQWLIEQSRSITLEQKKKVSTLAFFHIPLQEFMFMWNKNPTTGRKQESVCCPRKNNGIFSILKKYGQVKGIYVGHDHMNDYKGFYDGVELAYARKSGYGSYGPKGQKGARVINLKEYIDSQGKSNFIVNSFIIEEDGTIVLQKDYKWRGFKHFQIKCGN